MEMKPINSKVSEDMKFGQRVMIVTTPDADVKQNRDYWIGEFGIAYRHRRFKVGRWNEISIRYSRKSGAKTEYQKIKDGECKSQIFVFEFRDAFIVCSLYAIRKAIEYDIGYPKPNNDGITSAYYIPLTIIPHLMFPKFKAGQSL